LGEFFRCRYEYPDGTQGFYIAEQVSHHPPVSAFYYASPGHHLEIWGELRPKSKFLGNSAATIMEGTSKLRFGDRSEDGIYRITMPNMFVFFIFTLPFSNFGFYQFTKTQVQSTLVDQLVVFALLGSRYARGIVFGKMMLELGDESKVQNETNQVFCDVEFKTKGFFSGDYNAIGGRVRDKTGVVGEISGKWNEVMELKRTKVSLYTMFVKIEEWWSALSEKRTYHLVFLQHRVRQKSCSTPHRPK
jgi:preprotein translocase subunit SecG